MKRHNIIYIVLLLFIVLFGTLLNYKSVEGMTAYRYVMYGPWIGDKEYPAELKELEDGKKIYVINDGTYTKMVAEDGKEGKYYIGKINELNLNKWNQSTSTGVGKYLIRVEEDRVESARLKKAEEDERDRLAKIAAAEKDERDRLAKIAATEKDERDRLAKIAADENNSKILKQSIPVVMSTIVKRYEY
jgi:hypothetical protein